MGQALKHAFHVLIQLVLRRLSKKNGFVKDKFVPKITLAVRPIPKQIA